MLKRSCFSASSPHHNLPHLRQLCILATRMKIFATAWIYFSRTKKRKERSRPRQWLRGKRYVTRSKRGKRCKKLRKLTSSTIRSCTATSQRSSSPNPSQMIVKLRILILMTLQRMRSWSVLKTFRAKMICPTRKRCSQILT